MSILYKHLLKPTLTHTSNIQTLTDITKDKLRQFLQSPASTNSQPWLIQLSTEHYLQISLTPPISEKLDLSLPHKKTFKLDLDKTTKLTPHYLAIRNFTKLSDETLLYVLYFRNLEAIRLNMLNTDPISAERHLDYCHSLVNNTCRLMTLSSMDGHPMSVASINANQDWSKILDYGMYALGTLSPNQSASTEQRVPVHVIDSIMLAHLGLIHELQEVNFQFKRSNTKSLYVNRKYLHTKITNESEELIFTSLLCSPNIESNLQQIYDMCAKYQCCIEIEL